MSSYGNRGGGGRHGSGRYNDRYDDRGRGGGRGSGGRGGAGEGGRGGRGPPPPAPFPKVAISNQILCSITPNFTFRVYSIDCKSKSGHPIDSRSARQRLFYMGLFDPVVGYLARTQKMGEKEIASLRRVVFFQNSSFFAARAIPGLEAELNSEGGKKAVPLVGGGEGGPVSEAGDAMSVVDVTVYSCPLEMLDAEGKKRALAAAGATSAVDAAAGDGGVQQAVTSMDTLTLDRRCAICTKSFVNDQSLLAHCNETGHHPVMSPRERVVPANKELMVQYANVVLDRAMSERMAKWGREYIDPKAFTEPQDKFGKPLGVKIFKAYVCEFNLHKKTPHPNEPCELGLTIDLRAKVMRTKSLLHAICGDGNNPDTMTYDLRTQQAMRRKWNNEVIIAIYDKRCYSVIDLIFDHSPASLPVEGQNMSHAEYFQKRKNITLNHPNARPMVAVLGRNQSKIYMPAEVVCANELEPTLKAKLPSIASFTPQVRHAGIEEMKRYLKPGAQKTKGVGGGLLTALGFGLSDARTKVNVTRLALPEILAAGVKIPESQGGNWAPLIAKANYKANPTHGVKLNVILVHHKSISRNSLAVYDRIRNMVNNHNSAYQFGSKPFQMVEAGDMREHYGAIEKYFGGTKLPNNVFVLDLARPPRGQSSDPAYGVVKCYLGKGGYLSQFVNFQTYDHGDPRDERRSNLILSSVARQILSKCGVRVWWVTIPKSLPLPAVFVGVDVFHAPRKFNALEGKRKAEKESVAAIIVQIVRSHNPAANSMVEIYCETERRTAGKEMELGPVMNRAVSNALKAFKIAPKSCYVWRDGVGDNSIAQVAAQEIPAVRKALANPGQVGAGANSSGHVPLSYIVCQKRIATKFLTVEGNSVPCGAMVTDMQGPNYRTFYINGNSPPNSTPKPVRFIVAENDKELFQVSPSAISWALCHDYPNWPGPIKLPAPVQMAHKLAELAGMMDDLGESIDHKKYAGKIYFL